MTSIIKFTPLAGALNEGPNCYLLQVDEFTFLLDCGWSEDFDMDVINNVMKHISQVDAMLLTFPDIQHIGALPYLAGKIGLNCAIYATVPVYKMGQMFLYDLYQSHHNIEDFDKFTLDDVDSAFDKITQVKHNQTITLKDKGLGLSITPVHAGHMIGGTAWKIIKDDEEGEIVYAVDFNHKRERHLNGCSLFESSGETWSGKPPQLMITDGYNAMYQQARRKLRDEQLLTRIIETMRGDGNVLIAVDTAGRVLELAILLDQLWRDTRSGLCAYSLAMINNVTYNVVEFAKFMVEWMSDKIINSFTDQRNNPFHFKHLKLCHNLGDLAQVPQPKCVLASTADMECGFARQLFIRWAADPRNTVIITSRSTKGTLSRTLVDDPTVSRLKLEMKKRVPIIGEELDQYERNRAAKKATEVKVFEEESSDESDAEEPVNTIQNRHDFIVPNEVPKKSGSFFKQLKKTFPMYPFIEPRIKWDEYGEIINPDDFRMSNIIQVDEEVKAEIIKTKMEVDKTDSNPLQSVVEEAPTKCVTETVFIEMKCTISFIDFEGRSDGESMLKIIQQIKPREVIVVRADTKTTKYYAEAIRKALTSSGVEVFTPAVNEVVDTTKERHIYQVKLKDSLVGTLRFSNARDSEICWIDAKVDCSENVNDSSKVLTDSQIREAKEIADKEEFTMDHDGEDIIASQKSSNAINTQVANIIPSLEPLSIEDTPGHQTCFINELRLSDFKQVLTKEGYQAEFIGGVLVCNNMLAIRRNQQGHIDLEGTLTEEYYAIRDLLYQQYAVV
uniref:Cleavage and polyadenylation specificity factor subunit 2 n=1 Tax=Ciona intestinalis TaxID=7719 RepID=F6TGK6_CIOIN|nr:cleavage and polyadenylation specificity factor subunit 2-like [Ciona intestinalis]|eukprot:XP_026691028.1 cleavage and polyadenylation specificity factor subunit 2-like [Ciona intestinalis]